MYRVVLNGYDEKSDENFYIKRTLIFVHLNNVIDMIAMPSNKNMEVVTKKKSTLVRSTSK